MTFLRTWNITAAAIQCLLCMGLIVWSCTTLTEDTVFLLESGEYIGHGEGRLITTIPIIAIVLMLITFTAVTCLFHVLSACGIANYENAVKQGKNWMRWIEYSITSTIMLLVIALSSGVFAFESQLFIAICSICCMLCGLVSEQTTDAFSIHLTTAIGWILFVMSYGVILRHFIMNADKSPYFVFIMVVIMLGLYISFGLIHLVHVYKGRGDERINIAVEIAYTIDSMISKSTLTFIMSIGILTRTIA